MITVSRYYLVCMDGRLFTPRTDWQLHLNLKGNIELSISSSVLLCTAVKKHFALKQNNF